MGDPDIANFGSAGAADIVYRTRLDAPFANVTLGENGYRRGVGAGSAEVAPGLTLLGALEVVRNDGPWTVPEALKKTNGVLTLSGGTAAQGLSTSLMGYDASWTSTDQIPQRLIDAGTFDGRPFRRFDSLDPTGGGSTSRYSASGEWHRRGDDSATHVSAYAMRYRLDLFSNFTYALERPDTGDQFNQRDSRSIYGLDAKHSFDHALFGLAARSEVGVQMRHDRIAVGLFDTQARQRIATTREDDVRETLVGLYGETGAQLTPWLRGVAGLRADYLRARVDALTLAPNGGSASDSQLSPKLSLIAGPFAKTELFFNLETAIDG